MTRRKLLVFSLLAVALSLVLTLVLVLGVDLYLHRRAEQSAGLNRWGYRGPIVGRKQPGEKRVVMLGGSTVFGYGGPWHEAVPALLERFLNERTAPGAIRVINLGFNNEGAFAFLPTLQDFRYLDYDIVCLYEGYNDLPGDEGPNTAVFRHESPIFRLTGYFPILPVVLREKAMALRTGGNIDAAYAAERNEPGAKIVFRPNAGMRSSATVLEAASAVGHSLGRQLDRVAGNRRAQLPSTNTSGCARPWVTYCDSVYRAVKYARGEGKRVLVVAQPRVIDLQARVKHDGQQRELAGMLGRHFGNDPGIAYVDLRDAVDLSDRNLSFDEMHLGLDGNLVIAKALVEPVQRARSSSP
ncbi:MAG: hypothetical protein Q7R30_16410 [Acidobacteriota bacterium]|nr:hypothetical protein [Acidobacteriota bacterium]